MSMVQDQQAFRQALGRFTTGICVATTTTVDGTPVGMTINSFNSVSLDPPLVLWSIGRHTPSYQAFAAADGFAINVLSADQKAVSERFARPGDKFAGSGWLPGASGLPLLPGCIATFECDVAQRHDGGDHVIMIGAVRNYRSCPGEPLIYLDGGYGLAQSHAR